MMKENSDCKAACLRKELLNQYKLFYDQSPFPCKAEGYGKAYAKQTTNKKFKQYMRAKSEEISQNI